MIGHLTRIMNIAPARRAAAAARLRRDANEVLLAIPLFVFIGMMLERSRSPRSCSRPWRGCSRSLDQRLAIAVLDLVGTLLAAAKGIVGATTVAMGLIVLPT